ncbi:MAG TPA: SRPBCC domain-containing protein [Anaerolineaceae bacterium]|nr:SRPBCC domain-containing protein [Anaerolineaceae bacterium]
MAKIKLDYLIQAPVSIVFRNLSNAMALREWLCDVATIDPRPGGRIYLYWNTGYYTCGEFTRVEADKLIEFTWRCRGEPSETCVLIQVEDKDGKTELTLEHSGLGSDDAWEKARKEILHGWESGLRNLVYIIEAGPDLRIIKKPMMGILLAQFDPKRAAELGVPVKEGVLLGGVLDGMGAAKAGLQKDDVVVEISGIPTPTIPAMGIAMQGREAGDKVNMVFYRGSEKHSVEMELSHRPMPEVPTTGPALAARLRSAYQEALSGLHNALEGVLDEEASQSPSEGEWNIKETIAHLIHNERNLRSLIHQLVIGQEQVSDNFVDNLTIHNQATVAAYLSLEALMTALEYEISETVELVKRLPAEFSAHKGTFWRMGQFLTQMPGHVTDHIPQINAALAAARV